MGFFQLSLKENMSVILFFNGLTFEIPANQLRFLIKPAAFNPEMWGRESSSKTQNFPALISNVSH